MDMSNKQKFLDIYQACVTREGGAAFLEYLTEKTDFFTAPASTRFHGSYEGGLLEHSLNVYECLCDFVKRPRFKEKYGFTFSEESLAIVALLHDVCKKNDKLVIVVTHNQALKDMADVVITIKNGQIEQVISNAEPKPIEEIEW